MTTIYNHLIIKNKVQKELIKNEMKKKRAALRPFPIYFLIELSAARFARIWIIY